MRKLLIRDIWVLRLSGICVALGFLLLINSLWEPQAHLPELEAARPAEIESAREETAGPDAPDTEVAAAMESQTLPRRSIDALSAYKVTLKRPLFHATRRPAPEKPKVAQPKKPPKPKAPPRSNLNGVRLTGVIMTAEKSFGLLSIPGQSELTRAHEGKVVKGWKVMHVEEAALVLNNGEEIFRMALWKEKPGPGVAVTTVIQKTSRPKAPDRRGRTMAGGRH